MTDVLALGALHGLSRAGVDVPNEVAVVGFDDIEEASMSNPGLTTVHQDLIALGKNAPYEPQAECTDLPVHTPLH